MAKSRNRAACCRQPLESTPTALFECANAPSQDHRCRVVTVPMFPVRNRCFDWHVRLRVVLIQLQFTARDRMHVLSTELACSSLGKGGIETCCHAGDALLLSALGWLRPLKPPNAPDSFTAPPVPSCDFMSPNSPRPPPRRGREATGHRKPRSRRPGIVSKPRRPKPRRPRIGRRGNFQMPAAAR